MGETDAASNGVVWGSGTARAEADMTKVRKRPARQASLLLVNRTCCHRPSAPFISLSPIFRRERLFSRLGLMTMACQAAMSHQTHCLLPSSVYWLSASRAVTACPRHRPGPALWLD